MVTVKQILYISIIIMLVIGVGISLLVQIHRCIP